MGNLKNSRLMKCAVIAALIFSLTACVNSREESGGPVEPDTQFDLDSSLKDDSFGEPADPKNNYAEDIAGENDNDDDDNDYNDDELTRTSRSGNGYSSMPGRFGKSRNTRGYILEDAGNVTYENFLKLRPGMSTSEVREIFNNATEDAREFSTSTVIDFESDATSSTVYFDEDGQLDRASYLDRFRVCVEERVTSMEQFVKVRAGISYDDVVDILGEPSFKSYFGKHGRNEYAEYTWFSEDAIIDVFIDPTGKVTSFSQWGLQYTADKHSDYTVLTDRQLADNYNKIKLGIKYAELDNLMGNYIPLNSTKFRNGKFEDTFEFSRNYKGESVSITFVFEDGELINKKFYSPPESLLPKADPADGAKLRAGMTYDDVKGILGSDGFKEQEELTSYDDLIEKYSWKYPDDYEWISVFFENGVIDDEDDIHQFID